MKNQTPSERNQPSHQLYKRRKFFRGLLGTLAAGSLLAPFSKLFATETIKYPQPNDNSSHINMLEPLIGQIIIFAGNFAPRGWALCDGQMLSIAQNNALFSLLGTTYGGDGRTTFALPDLRGRAPIHAGQGPGLSHRQLGSPGGSEKLTLTTAQLPAHHHDATGMVQMPVNKKMTSDKPSLNSKQGDAQGSLLHSTSDSKEKYTGASVSVQTKDTGGGEAFDTMQPYLPVNYIIALQGIYPSRS